MEEGDVEAVCAAVRVVACGAVLVAKAANEAEGDWEGTWTDTVDESVKASVRASDGAGGCFCVISEESLTNCAGLWPQENPETLLVLIMFLQ